MIEDSRWWIRRWLLMSAVMIIAAQIGCNDDESDQEEEVLDGALYLEVEGVPEGHTPEIILSGDQNSTRRVIEESTVIEDLQEGPYVLEARTIIGDGKSWYVDPALTEFEFDPAEDKTKRLEYQPIELEVSERAVGFRDDHDEAMDIEALVGASEVDVSAQEDEDFETYQESRTLEFDANRLDGELEAGDLLSFEPNEHMPYGYLGEVESVEHHHDEELIIVETRRAPLTDLIPQGAIAEVGGLKYTATEIEPMVDDFYATPKPLAPEAQALLGATGFIPDVDIGDEGLCFRVDELEIYDDDDGTVEAGGGFCLDAEISFDFRTSLATLDYAHLIARFDKTGDLWADFDGEVDVHTRQSVPFAKLRLPPLTFSVGPIPVSIHTYVRLMLEVGATAEGELKAELTVSNTLETGVTYDGNIRPIFRNDGSAERSLNNHLSKYTVRGGVGPNLEFLIYDTVGPTFGVSAFVEYDVETGRSRWWRLYAGVGGYLGFRIQLPGVPFVSYSEEFQVAENKWLIDHAPPDEIGVEYYGNNPMDDDVQMLPCTTYEGVELQVIDPYEEQPTIYPTSRETAGVHSPEKVREESGDDGEIITTWAVDYDVPRNFSTTQTWGPEFILYDHSFFPDRRHRLAKANFPVVGQGGIVKLDVHPPDNADVPEGELVRLETDGLPDHDYREIVDGDFHDECTPPGDYRLEMPAIEVDGVPYLPSVYESGDHARTNPLATGDEDGVSYQFFAGGDEKVLEPQYVVGVDDQERDFHYEKQSFYEVDYQQAPSGSVTFQTDDDHLLADGPALLHIEGVDVDYERTYQFSEGNDHFHFQFYEDGTYELELELPTYNGIPVEGGLPQGDGIYEFEVNNHFYIDLSFSVPPPSVGWLDPDEVTLGSSGGELDYQWDSHAVTGYTVEVDPEVMEPLALDAEDDEFSIEFPANDDLEPDHYEVTLIGHGAEEGVSDSDTAQVMVEELEPAVLNVNTVGFRGDDTAADAAELTVEGPDGQTWTATQPWPHTIDDLVPGQYTIGDDFVSGDVYDFTTGGTDIDLAPGQEATAAIQYQPTTATLQVDAQGPDGFDPGDVVDVTGPDGFDEQVSLQGAQFTHLSPGGYTVTVDDTQHTHDDGSTIEAVDTTLSTTLDAGDDGHLTVEYQRVDGRLDLNRISGDAPSAPVVEVYDEDGDLVATVDDDHQPWLSPGVYTLEVEDYYHSGNLYYPVGVGEVTIEADETTVADVEYQRVSAQFHASPDTVRPDDPETTLSWDVDVDEDLIDLSIEPDVGSIGASGDQTVTPDVGYDDDSFTYTLSASGDSGTAEWTLELNVSEDDLIIEKFTVDGDDEVYVEHGAEVTFEWKVTGPEPDWHTIPFEVDDPDKNMPMEGSETVSTDDMWCWGPECYLEVQTSGGQFQSELVYVHHADEPTIYADDEYHMISGHTEQFEVDIGHEMYGTDGSFELNDDSQIEQISFTDDNEYWQNDNNYTPPIVEIEAADDAEGVEEVDLTVTNEFGDDTATLEIHFGVTNTDDDVDAPPPGSLRWAVENSEPGDTITFDPDTFDDSDDPATIELQEAIEIEDDLTVAGQGSDTTVIRGPQDDDLDVGKGTAFIITPGYDVWGVGMAVTIRDLAIVDSVEHGFWVRGFAGDPTEYGFDLTIDGVAVRDHEMAAIRAVLPRKSYDPNVSPYSGLTIIDTVVESNDGDALLAGGGESIEIISSRFEDNSAGVNILKLAGHQDIDAPMITIDDTEIIDNHGKSALIVRTGPVEIIDTTIIGGDDSGFTVASRGLVLRYSDDVDYDQTFSLSGDTTISDVDYKVLGMHDFGDYACLEVGEDVQIGDGYMGSMTICSD